MEIEEIYSAYMYSYPHKTAYRELENIDMRSYTGMLQEQQNGLYIHIPFCETKCGYCNLFSVTGGKEEDFRLYIEAIDEHAKQLKSIASFAQWNSFILGGGTPMILPERELEQVFQIVEERLDVDHKTVYSGIETSPNQTAASKLSILKDFNMDRVSIGVQSFIEEELMMLRRHHKVKAAMNALDLIIDRKSVV